MISNAKNKDMGTEAVSQKMEATPMPAQKGDSYFFPPSNGNPAIVIAEAESMDEAQRLYHEKLADRLKTFNQ